MGVHDFYLFLLQNIDSRYSLDHLVKAVLTSTYNLCIEQKYEKYQNFYLEIFISIIKIGYVAEINVQTACCRGNAQGPVETMHELTKINGPAKHYENMPLQIY